MHAVEFLKKHAEIPCFNVLSGSQRHLKQAVFAIYKKLVIDDDETSLTRFTGRDIDLQTVSDELRTVSMWGDRRLIIVDDADEFVTKNRAALEKLIEKPFKKSVLVLDVQSWPKTTRIYKQVAAKGMDIECSDLKGAQLIKWLQDTAAETYEQTLARDAAALMIELVGSELGMLDTELAKLASYVGMCAKIEIEDVKSMVGGWRTETTWAMTDATRDNDLDFALNALDQLLAAGEPPIKLLGGISYTFKKFSYSTDASRSMSLDQALRQAGVFPMAIMQSQSYLRRLGRTNAERILRKLLDADAGLKGANPLPERFQLERLLLELSGRSV